MTPPDVSRSDGGARTAWRVMALVGVLLLAFAWGLGQVVDEARSYAAAQGLAADTSQDQATQTLALVCAGVLLIGAALLRSSVGRRRRQA